MPRRSLHLALGTLALALSACQPAARATASGDAAPAPPTTPTPPATPATPATPVGGVGMPAPIEPPVPQSPPQAVLAVGEDAAIANGRLRLLRVVSDSRCPKDAQCIWEGEVTLAFEFSDAGGKHAFELARRSHPSANVGDATFALDSYGPCPAGRKDSTLECAVVTTNTAATR